MSKEKISRKLHNLSRKGRYGGGTAPYGWEAKNAGSIGGRSGGRAKHPSHKKGKEELANESVVESKEA
jgi:hypothetical protein